MSNYRNICCIIYGTPLPLPYRCAHVFTGCGVCVCVCDSLIYLYTQYFCKGLFPLLACSELIESSLSSFFLNLLTHISYHISYIFCLCPLHPLLPSFISLGLYFYYSFYFQVYSCSAKFVVICSTLLQFPLPNPNTVLLLPFSSLCKASVLIDKGCICIFARTQCRSFHFPSSPFVAWLSKSFISRLLCK